MVISKMFLNLYILLNAGMAMDIRLLEEPRNVALIGILGAIGFSVLWIATVLIDGSWVFGEMTLSELGDPSRPADMLFNISCILSGLVLAVFAFAMRSMQKVKLVRASMGLAGAASVFLIGVGLFPIHIDFWHGLFSWAFFLTMMTAIILSVPGDWSRGGRARGIAGVSGFMVLVAVLLLALTPLALAEAIAVIFIMVWVLMRSFDLIL